MELQDIRKGDYIRSKQWKDIDYHKSRDGRPSYWNHDGEMDYLLTGEHLVYDVRDNGRDIHTISKEGGYWFLRNVDCILVKATNRFY